MVDMPTGQDGKEILFLADISTSESNEVIEGSLTLDKSEKNNLLVFLLIP